MSNKFLVGCVPTNVVILLDIIVGVIPSPDVVTWLKYIPKLLDVDDE